MKMIVKYPAFVAAMMIVGVSVANASSNRIWFDPSIKLSDGRTIWASLDRNNNCYTVSVGPGRNTSGISGYATNCGDKVEGHWALRGCGKDGNINADVAGVINWIVNRCN